MLPKVILHNNKQVAHKNLENHVSFLVWQKKILFINNNLTMESL
jgi:hypothetical protein